MNLVDDIHLYLPKYLSEESTRKLIDEIGNFPDNISHALYTSKIASDNIVFQGDAINSLPVINLPDYKISNAPSIILSNTCDMDLTNERAFPSQICYAPIFQLEKYVSMLKSGEKYKNNNNGLSQHIEKIKKQHITQILYLPIGSELEYEGIVFLDRINNCQNRTFGRENLHQKRLFSLSNYGLYLLLIKLSIHFSRLQEKVDRDEGKIV